MNRKHYEAANIYATKNPSDPFAKARILNRLEQGAVTPMGAIQGRSDEYPPTRDDQYITRELEAFHVKRERRNGPATAPNSPK